MNEEKKRAFRNLADKPEVTNMIKAIMCGGPLETVYPALAALGIGETMAA